MPSVSEYISTRPGQLKIAEMVLSLAAFISAMMAEVILTPTKGVSIYVFTIWAFVFASTVFVLSTFASDHQPRAFPVIVLIINCMLTAQLLGVGILAAVRAYQFTLVFQMFLPFLMSYAYMTIACACFILADFIVFAIDIYFAYSAWKSWKSSYQNPYNTGALAQGLPAPVQGFPSPAQGFPAPVHGFSPPGQGLPASQEVSV
ncbi:uncharacterized protein LOC135475909 [Liolophura sinensis]|uniref:uncharacterized protein LOC135475909 n=1 Tax=Liolophura sinensis TaxID=3198878 RepID=UPI003159790A